MWRTGFTGDFWFALAMLVLAALAARALAARLLQAGHGRRPAAGSR